MARIPVPSSKEILKERLSRHHQIKLAVVGRTSGRTISMPVWFVLEGQKVYLSPLQGSETQWYRNVLKNPSIRTDARGAKGEFRAVPITDAKAVKSVVEKFREEYGAKDVKRYYSKFDVAVGLYHAEPIRRPAITLAEVIKARCSFESSLLHQCSGLRLRRCCTLPRFQAPLCGNGAVPAWMLYVKETIAPHQTNQTQRIVA
jgi:hypothetical protein